MSMLVEFEDFPDEKEVIGELLTAYGELEFALLGCLMEVLNLDINTTTRILFRIKGEAARIDVSDAILRPAFKKVGLDGQWSNALGAIRHAKSARNQYAHCHWQTHENKLYFINFDQDAQSPAEQEMHVTYHNVDFALLKKQKEYFEYALEATYYLFFEYRKKVGRLPNHIFSFPKSIAQPPLYNQAASGPDPSSPQQASKKPK